MWFPARRRKMFFKSKWVNFKKRHPQSQGIEYLVQTLNHCFLLTLSTTQEGDTDRKFVGRIEEDGRGVCCEGGEGAAHAHGASILLVNLIIRPANAGSRARHLCRVHSDKPVRENSDATIRSP